MTRIAFLVCSILSLQASLGAPATIGERAEEGETQRARFIQETLETGHVPDWQPSCSSGVLTWSGVAQQALAQQRRRSSPISRGEAYAPNPVLGLDLVMQDTQIANQEIAAALPGHLGELAQTLNLFFEERMAIQDLVESKTLNNLHNLRGDAAFERAGFRRGSPLELEKVKAYQKALEALWTVREGREKGLFDRISARAL